MKNRYYLTSIANCAVEVMLISFDALTITFTDAHCVQWHEDIVFGNDLEPDEWRELVDENGIRPAGIETMLRGLTRDDLTPPMDAA